MAKFVGLFYCLTYKQKNVASIEQCSLNEQNH